MDDILGLFGTPSQTSAPAPVIPSTPLASSTFLPTPATVAPSHSAPPTSQQKLTTYPAYEKNGLKITLTPQTSAARPGVVMILARFQVTGVETATGLSFQAAVPKVRGLVKLAYPILLC